MVQDVFNSMIALGHQFALLLLIIDELKTLDLNMDSSSFLEINSVELYDPVFNDIDKKLLTDIYSFKLESINCKCMKQVNLAGKKNTETEHVLNFFYMPHCGKALYNNLLYANWSIENLNSIMILGMKMT